MEGIPDVLVGDGFIQFTLKGGEKVRIPGIAIHRDSVRVIPGGNDMVNLMQVEFLCGKITVEDMVFFTEVVPNKTLVSVDDSIETVTRHRA